jgi:hypothetical protein
MTDVTVTLPAAQVQLLAVLATGHCDRMAALARELTAAGLQEADVYPFWSIANNADMAQRALRDALPASFRG